MHKRNVFLFFFTPGHLCAIVCSLKVYYYVLATVGEGQYCCIGNSESDGRIACLAWCVLIDLIGEMP